MLSKPEYESKARLDLEEKRVLDAILNYIFAQNITEACQIAIKAIKGIINTLFIYYRNSTK